MQDSIRRLSANQAAEEVRDLALAFAAANGLTGSLLHVVPDSSSNEIEGKTKVHWAAVFSRFLNGHEIDGPIVLRVNLRDREVKWAADV